MKLNFPIKLNRRAHRDSAPPVKAKEIAPHFELGSRGEALALEHLDRAGYHIVAANFSVPIGRNTRVVIVNAEIDVVAYDGPTLCFIEVKTRVSNCLETFGRMKNCAKGIGKIIVGISWGQNRLR